MKQHGGCGMKDLGHFLRSLALLLHIYTLLASSLCVYASQGLTAVAAPRLSETGTPPARSSQAPAPAPRPGPGVGTDSNSHKGSLEPVPAPGPPPQPAPVPRSNSEPLLQPAPVATPEPSFPPPPVAIPFQPTSLPPSPAPGEANPSPAPSPAFVPITPGSRGGWNGGQRAGLGLVVVAGLLQVAVFLYVMARRPRLMGNINESREFEAL